MNKIKPNFRRAVHIMIGVAASVLFINASWAQTPAASSPTSMPQVGAPLIDPPRWFQGDATPEEQYQTLKKEAGAVLQESSYACKQMKGTAAATCMKQARMTYSQDLARAKEMTKTAGR